MKINSQPLAELNTLVGGVDIYLLDQILKGRFPAGARILDAGCGGGRNISWFLRSGYDVCGVDMTPGSIAAVQGAAARLAPRLPADNFRVEPVEALSFANETFNAVLSIAVLHFARDPQHFEQMIHEMWRVLKTGGVLFARLASTIGIEDRVRPIGNGHYAVPDGSVRYLVDLERLQALTKQLNGRLIEPIKTVNVQNLRCMTTWVVEKE